MRRSLLGVDVQDGVAVHYDSARAANEGAAREVAAHLQLAVGPGRTAPGWRWVTATVPQQTNGTVEDVPAALPLSPLPQSFLTLAKPEGVDVGADCGVWTLLFMRALVHQLAFGDDLRLPTELAIAQTPRAMRCEAQELIERLAFAAQPTPTPLPDVPVLALDGASGSGKSSCIADLEHLIAADLHGAVHLIVLHQDDYFLVRLHKHQRI